MLKVE